MIEKLSTHLLALEEQLLQPSIRSNPAAVASLLADEFREFGSTGRVYTRHEILAALTTEAPRTITLYDFTCRQLAPEAALLTYRSRSKTGDALRSSLWIQRGERWQMLFHQGTNVPASNPAEAVS